MNLKNNKGITLITLVITVVLLSILTYTGIQIGIDMTNAAKFEKIESYMLMIQNSCEIRENQIAIGDKEEFERYGEVQTSDNLEGNWYRLRQWELNEIGLKDAKEADGYYVDYTKVEQQRICRCCI